VLLLCVRLSFDGDDDETTEGVNTSGFDRRCLGRWNGWMGEDEGSEADAVDAASWTEEDTLAPPEL
jgi:hypothetical protein